MEKSEKYQYIFVEKKKNTLFGAMLIVMFQEIIT